MIIITLEKLMTDMPAGYDFGLSQLSEWRKTHVQPFVFLWGTDLIRPEHKGLSGVAWDNYGHDPMLFFIENLTLDYLQSKGFIPNFYTREHPLVIRDWNTDIIKTSLLEQEKIISLVKKNHNN